MKTRVFVKYFVYDSRLNLQFIKDFEMQLFNYAHSHISTKNSPNRLYIYAKIALKMHDRDTLTMNKHKKMGAKLKKVDSIT